MGLILRLIINFHMFLTCNNIMLMQDELLKELTIKQIKNIPPDKKLQYSDLRRISQYIDTSIFDENKCCLWSGYITNENKLTKGTYVNFYLRKNKSALHRLLYINFIGDLTDDHYIRYTCNNKGKCCNVNHFKKIQYAKKNNNEIKISKQKIQPKVLTPDDIKKRLTVSFS